MNYKTLSIFTILVLASALFFTDANAEIKRSSMQDGKYIKVLVSNDDWVPEGFKSGLVIPASFSMDSNIMLDGIDDESAWLAAEEVIVPLSHGKVKSARLKVLYTDEDVLMRIRWADSSEDRLYRPWVWNEKQGKYESGLQVEDSLFLSFEVGCEWFPSLLSGYEFDYDGWHWMAGRSDPSGQAVDVVGAIKETAGGGRLPYTSRNNQREWNLKFDDVNDGIIEERTLHSNWNQLDRKYEIWPVDSNTVYFGYWVDGRRDENLARQLPPPANPPSDPAALPPQFELLELQDNANDVQAKGHWKDGFWTVELRRKRITEAGLSYDVQFERLTQFSLNVFDGTERLDQASESQRLFLQFLDKKPLMASQ